MTACIVTESSTASEHVKRGALHGPMAHGCSKHAGDLHSTNRLELSVY